jgi:hypothetical protein
MTFFEPGTVSYSRAFSIPMPALRHVSPQPLLRSPASLVELRAGNIAGLAMDLTGGKPLRFSTEFEPPMDWVRGIHLAYRLPPASTDSDSCALTLQFNWTNGKTERHVCFEKREGTIFVPIAAWLGANERPNEFGQLRSIDWTLRPPEHGPAEMGLEAFNLRYSIEGWASTSAADELRLSPLFFAGNDAVFADAGAVNEVASSSYKQKFSLTLDSKALPKILAIGAEIRPMEHPFFTLDQLAVEPAEPLSEKRWRELSELPVVAAPSRWPKWLAWTFVILSLGLVWYKRRWARHKVITLGKSVGNFALRHLRPMPGFAWSRLQCWWPRLNLAIGILALGPGLWIAGRLGFTFAGMMLLVGAALVAWGAYFHWREPADDGRSETDSSVRVRLAAFAVALGCAVWSIGHQSVSASALWGFLPLVGAIYWLGGDIRGLLPPLHVMVRGVSKHRRYMTFASWLLAAASLYWLGSQSKALGSENYFFALAGLAAVFTLRAGLLALETPLSRRFPTAAEKVYRGAGGLYFAGALAMLISTAIAIGVGHEAIAEQLAIVVYYSLLIGTGRAVLALRTRGPMGAADGTYPGSADGR